MISIRINLPPLALSGSHQRHRLKGDIFVAQMRASVPNHGGIYLGDGLILHHPAGHAPLDHGRLARTEPLQRYRPFIVFWLRYHAPLTARKKVSS